MNATQCYIYTYIVRFVLITNNKFRLNSIKNSPIPSTLTQTVTATNIRLLIKLCADDKTKPSNTTTFTVYRCQIKWYALLPLIFKQLNPLQNDRF